MRPDSQPAQLRIAIIGSGGAASLHASVFAQNPRVSIRVIVSSDLNRVAALAERVGAQASTDLHSTMFRSDIDVCLIATLPSRHAQLIFDSVAAGKIVFAEKPVGVSRTDLSLLRSIKPSQIDRIYVNFNRRFDPTIKDVVKHLRDLHEEAYFAAITSRDKSTPPPYYLESCGGLSVDTMSHDFDLTRYVFNSEISEAKFELQTLSRQAYGYDQRQIAVVGRMQSGALFTIHCARAVGYGYDQHLQVLVGNERIETAYSPTNRSVLHGPAGTSTANFDNDYSERYLISFKNSVDHFISSIYSGARFAPGLSDGLAALEWGLVIQEQCR